MKNTPDRLYDLKELEIIAPGDDVFMTDMIRLFIEQIETTIQDVSTLTAKKNYAAIKSILHKIKPSIMVMGMTIATETILQIEKLELSAKNDAVFLDLIMKLEKNFQKVNDQLRLL